MVGWLLLWLVGNDGFWPVLVFGYLAHLLLPVAFVWLPLALYRRRWASVVVEGICLAAFVWLFGDYFIPPDPDPPPEGSTVITVMTYNLGDGLATPDRLVPLLRDSGADLIGLEEVNAEMAAALAVDLKDAYPYQVLHGLGIPGKGLLSRYPILTSDLLEFNPGRPDLRAVVDLGGTTVTVIVAHPPPPRLTRTGLGQRPGTAGQVEGLLATVAATEGPLLLLGDFNVTTMHDLYRRLERADLTDVFRAVGRGFGFTSPAVLARLDEHGIPIRRVPFKPVLRIDYVWTSRHWQPLAAWVGPSAGSDHLPVLARLALPPS
jgi:endonuclease/exonuclease/phosphatase (EEP) superfamily protein YafD